MRHLNRDFKINRKPSHVKALLANQVCSLIYHGRIKTTVTKAKEVRRWVEKMVTYAKRGTLHHRRMVIAKIHQKDAVRLLFNEIAPGFMDRSGGYTRIIRLGRRIGDAAPICFLEFVESAIPHETPNSAFEHNSEDVNQGKAALNDIEESVSDVENISLKSDRDESNADKEKQ